MRHLSIKIHRCNQEEPAWDDKFELELELDRCTIIEQGMGSGEPAIAFSMVDPSTGKRWVAQTSATIIDNLAAAIRGAKGFWAKNPVENIWKF